MSTSGGDIEVAVRAAGAGETQRELERVEDQLDETAGSMGDSAQEMNQLNRRMMGLGQTVVAGLAVVAGGILSQLPVLREVGSGISAVLDSLVFKIDQDVRPGVQDLANDFFELSGEIADAEDSAEAIGLALGGFAEILRENILNETQGMTIEQSIDFVVRVGEVAFDRGGFRDAMRQRIENAGVGGVIVDALRQTVPVQTAEFAFNLGADMGFRLVEGFTGQEIEGDFSDVMGRVLDRIESDIGGLGQDAREWGRNLVESFADGIRGRIGQAVSAVEDLVERVRSYLPFSPAERGPLADLDQAGPGLTDTFAPGIASGTGAVGQAASQAAGAGDPRRDRTGVFGGTREQLAVFIGGRQADQGVARYRDDNTLRRGRPQ